MGYRLGVKGEIQIFSGVDGLRLYHVRTCEISPYYVEREGSLYSILESDHSAPYATMIAVEESTHSFHAAAFEDSGAVYIRYGSSNA
jgi:hypothetical protein